MTFENVSGTVERDPEMEQHAEEAAQIARDAGLRIMDYFTQGNVMNKFPTPPQGAPHDLASEVRDDVYRRTCDLLAVNRTVRRDVARRIFGMEV